MRRHALRAGLVALALAGCGSALKAHLKSAHTYLELDNFPAAVAEWREALKIDPANAEATEALARHADRIKTTSEALYLKGIASYTDGRLEEAMDAWVDCLRLTPENARAAEYLKKAREKKKNIESYK